MLVLRNIVASLNWSCTLIWNRSPLLPRITGPGKIPPGRTALDRVYEGLRGQHKMKNARSTETIGTDYHILYNQVSNRSDCCSCGSPEEEGEDGQ
jgi:hypothetical protein